MEKSNIGSHQYRRYHKPQSKTQCFTQSKKPANQNMRRSNYVRQSSSSSSDLYDTPETSAQFSSQETKNHLEHYKQNQFHDDHLNSSSHGRNYRHSSSFDETQSRDKISLPSSSVEDDGPSGSVINGRYVRKDSGKSISSSLNAGAAPFVPKTFPVEPYSKSMPSNSTGARNKYEDRRPREGPRAPTYNRDAAYHPKGGHFTHGMRQAFVKSKSSRYMNRKGSLIDSDFGPRGDMYQENSELDTDFDPVRDRVSKLELRGKIDVSKSKESTTQRERLVAQLEKEECECLVCCEPIRVQHYIWSCSNCYHVFHLHCIKKWARSSTAIVKDCGWRCPACQNIEDQVPFNYYCFCGKQKDPKVNYHYTPHSCGDACRKKREEKHCVHACNILCHPGPCPPCTARINRSCACGKSEKNVSCAKSETFTCSSTCDKLLNCGMHSCKDSCHIGNCKPCDVTLTQKCFCGNNERTVLCEPANIPLIDYCCESICKRNLACSKHTCVEICHPGPCGSCSLLPALVMTCPCGKVLLKDMEPGGEVSPFRQSCTDPIPVCENKCTKELPCGPKSNHHKCESNCHSGDCSPCKLTTMVKCRCGAMSKEVPCADITKSPFVFLCGRRCKKRKDCGRHKCLNTCCIHLMHTCELVCNKKLTCGLHHCQEKCHMANCPTCWNVSFDELRCECGHNVLYPPVACGTRPPECNQPCSRSHPCDHKTQHSCHSEEKCPPCTVLTVKLCFGQHERRSNVQCFLDGISCGKPCRKPLSCGRHLCPETCHMGDCLKPGVTCSQPCLTLRSCEHPCGVPCHEGPCPDTVCRAQVVVTCPCGLRQETTSCSEDISAYRMISASMMASKMQDIKDGESVNLNDIFGKRSKNNRLQCNEECAITERNKRLAVALQIQNPDLSCKPGAPNYSEFLKEEAKKNLKFVSGVYDKITELVQLAKQSKQKSRSYSFPSMKRNPRRVVHELAEFFGCETQSYDEEPVKHVVVTAFREKSWLPFVSIITVTERDMGIRRGPAPVVSCLSKPEKKEKIIDYFDFDG